MDPEPKKEAKVLVAPEAEGETVNGVAGLNGEVEDAVAPKGDDDEGAVNVKDPGLSEKELELEVVSPNPPNLGADGTGGICRMVCNQNKVFDMHFKVFVNEIARNITPVQWQ